jgi:hypothetical protein
MHSEDDQTVPYVAAGPLSAKLLKNRTLKTYKDFPEAAFCLGCSKFRLVVKPEVDQKRDAGQRRDRVFVRNKVKDEP